MREDFERALAEKEEDITLRVKEIKEELRREQENKQKLHEAQLDAVKVQMEEELRVELEIKMKDASAHGYESAMAAAKETYQKLADEHAQEKQALQELVSKLEEDLKDSQRVVEENESLIQELKDAAVVQEEALEARIDEAVAARVAEVERDYAALQDTGKGGRGKGGGGGGGGECTGKGGDGDNTGETSPRTRAITVDDGSEDNQFGSPSSTSRKTSIDGRKLSAKEAKALQIELERIRGHYEAQLLESRSHLKTAQAQLYSQVERFNKLEEAHSSLKQEHEQAKIELEEAASLQAALHEQVLATAMTTSATAGDVGLLEDADPAKERSDENTTHSSKMAIVSREKGDAHVSRGNRRRRSISFDLPTHQAGKETDARGQGTTLKDDNSSSGSGASGNNQNSHHPSRLVDHKQVLALKKKLGEANTQRKHISTLNIALTKKCARMAERVSELEQLEMTLKLDAQRKAKQLHKLQGKQKNLEQDLASAKKGIASERADREAAVVKLALHYEELVRKWKGVSFRAMSGSVKKASKDAMIELEVEGNRGGDEDVGGNEHIGRARVGGGSRKPRPFLPVNQQIDAMDHALRQSARIHANRE